MNSITTEFEWTVTIRYAKEERVFTVRDAKTRYQAVMPCIEEVIKEFSLPGRPYQYWASNPAKFGLEGLLEIQVNSSEDGRRTSGVKIERRN